MKSQRVRLIIDGKTVATVVDPVEDSTSEWNVSPLENGGWHHVVLVVDRPHELDGELRIAA